MKNRILKIENLSYPELESLDRSKTLFIGYLTEVCERGEIQMNYNKIFPVIILFLE